jgi:monoamine oxidase
LINSILFEPNLPENIIQLNKTHTWMGESIKFSVEYKTPFGKKRIILEPYSAKPILFKKCTTTVPPIIQDLL